MPGEGANRPPEVAATEFDPLKKSDGEETVVEGSELLVSPTAASHSAAQTLVGVSQAIGDKGDSSRVCGICGESGHNRRTCPRPGDDKSRSFDKNGASGDGIGLAELDAEGKAAMLNLPNLPMSSATQHSYLQAFAVGTGLMSHPSAAGNAYRTQQDLVMLSSNGRVIPAAVSKEGGGGKSVEELEREEQLLTERIRLATERKAKAEEELANIEKEAAEAEAKLAALVGPPKEDDRSEPMEGDKTEDEDKMVEDEKKEDDIGEDGRPSRAGKRKADDEASPTKDLAGDSLAAGRPRRTRG